MKDEATPEQLAMARRIAFAVYREQPGAHEAGYDKYIAEGGNDGDEAVQSALAAIIETQRLDAELVDSMTLKMPGIGTGLVDGASLARRQIVSAIRAGKHYGKDQQ